MKLTKYELPASPLDQLFDRLNWGVPTLDRFLSSASPDDQSWTSFRLPRTNVRETEDAFIFALEMPGLDKKDVSINLEGDVLVVKGEKTETQEETGVIRREYRAERFERSFGVNGVNRDGVKARMENGILTVTLPKVPEKVGRKIEIA